MKKIFAVVLSVMMVLVPVGCGGKGGPASDQRDNSRQEATTAASVAGESSKSAEPGAVSGSDMEIVVAKYLSAIGGPESISLCGGTSIEYIPGNEWGFAGDMWEITGPDLAYKDLKASLEEQLIAGAGFKRDYAMTGNIYYVPAGTEKLGLILWGWSEGEGTYTIQMSHTPESYAQSYIESARSAAPTVIGAANALEVLPESFELRWKLFYSEGETNEVCIARMDRKWYYHLAWDGGNIFKIAAVPDGTGGYEYFEWTDDESPRSVGTERFSSYGSVDELLSQTFDFEGFTSTPGISTWLQMCKDYLDGTPSENVVRFAIYSGMEKTGEENIGGHTCEIVTYDNWGQTIKYIVEPETGLLFGYGESDYEGNMQDKYQVSVYTQDPSTLFAPLG